MKKIKYIIIEKKIKSSIKKSNEFISIEIIQKRKLYKTGHSRAIWLAVYTQVYLALIFLIGLMKSLLSKL